MTQILISGRSYLQAREYAKAKGYDYLEWSFIDAEDKMRGLRGLDIRLEALPGTPDGILVQARLQELKIIHAPN